MDRVYNNGFWRSSHNENQVHDSLNEGRYGVYNVTAFDEGVSIAGSSLVKYEVDKFGEKYTFSKEELLNDQELILQFINDRKITRTIDSVINELKTSANLFPAFIRHFDIRIKTTQTNPLSERPGTRGIQHRHVDVARPAQQVRQVAQHPPLPPWGYLHENHLQAILRQNAHHNAHGALNIALGHFGIPGDIGQRPSPGYNRDQQSNGCSVRDKCLSLMSSISVNSTDEQNRSIERLLERIDSAEHQQSKLFQKFQGILECIQNNPEFIDKVVVTINTILEGECQDKTSAVMDQLDLEVQLFRLPAYALSYDHLDYPNFFAYLKRMYNEDVLIKVMTSVKDRQNNALINNDQSVHVKAFLKNYFTRNNFCRFATGEAIERYRDYSRRSGVITDELLYQIQVKFILQLGDVNLYQEYLKSLLIEAAVDQNPLVDFLVRHDDKLRDALENSSQQGMDLMHFEQVAEPSTSNPVEFARNMVSSQSMAKNKMVREHVMTKLEQIRWDEIIRLSNE